MTATESAPSEATFDLPEKLDTAACVDLEPKLRAALGNPLTFDAQKVTFLGGLCVELLLSARADCAAAGQPLAVHNPSEDMVKGLELLGLSLSDITYEVAA